MIEEDYVSFETAKLMKEKGFDEPCVKKVTRGVIPDVLVIEASEESSYPQPTIQIAMKWLREVHNLFIFISTWLKHKNGTVQYYYEIRNLNDKDFETIAGTTITEFDSPEKTSEAAIKYCLENLI